VTTDINLFMGIIGLCSIASVFGLWKKIPFLMLVGGAVITFMAILPIDVSNGSRVESITESGNDNIINWEDDPAQLDVYPKIFFGLLGSMFMLAGALVWKED
jgi:hypothetical protein